MKMVSRRIQKEFSDIPIEILEEFYRNDPSDNHKYVKWMCQVYQNDSSRKGHIMDSVKVFHTMVINKKLKDKEKDIYQYRTTDEVDKAVADVSVPFVHKDKKIEAEKVFENNKCLVMRIDNYAASVFYGKKYGFKRTVDAKWCISLTDNDHHFNNYTNSGIQFYFIISKQDDEKFAVASYFGGKIDCYDRQDQLTEIKKVMEKYEIPYE